MSNCNIQISGLDISSESQRAIEIIVLALQSKSPSDSSICFQIVNGECEVNGFLRVNSSMVSFETSHSGNEPWLVAKALTKVWQAKLDLWKKSRVF